MTAQVDAAAQAAQEAAQVPQVQTAPGLQAASRERLAAFTMPVTTGSPESTCTITEALAFTPAESMAVKLIL